MNKNDNVGPKRQTGLWLNLGHKPVGLVVQEGTVAAEGEKQEGAGGSVEASRIGKNFCPNTQPHNFNFNSNSNSKLQLQLQTERNRAAMRCSI